MRIHWSLIALVALGAGLTAFLSCRPDQAVTLKETVADDPRFADLQLTMAGNPTTGEISALFSYKGAGFSPGEKTELAYDVVSNGTGTVNCSALKRRASVTLAGDGQEGRFSVRIDPKAFASPIQPHPEGLAKFDTTRDDAIWNGPMKVEGCLIIGGHRAKTATAAVQAGLSLASEDGINAYGALCAAKLGKIPAFSCLDDELFKELPITATSSGGTTAADRRIDRCDRPIYLPTGGGDCKPWARIGRIKTGANSYAAVVCRRYWPEAGATANPAGAGSGIPSGLEDTPASGQPDSWKRNPSDPSDPYFNDVAIIQYDYKTGDTCYFQALGVLYAKRVPPPDEEQLPEPVPAEHPAAKNAESFWLTPQGVAGINCINCHDADPWMHSPYVRQVLDADGEVFLPSKPKVKRYNLIGGEFGFGSWTQAYLVAPANGAADACLTCHNVGSLNGCTSWAPDVGSGKHFANSKTPFGKEFPQAHWMPPDHGEASAADWDASYGDAISAFAKCCNVPGAELGISSPFGAQARYGKRLTAAQIAKLEAAGCKVTPRNTSTTGMGSP